MKTLDKKLFVILKYIIILIPLFIALFNIGKAMFIGYEVTKAYSSEQNENVWQYRDNQIDNYDGGNLTEQYINNVIYGNFDFVSQLKKAVNEAYSYLPKNRITISGNIYYTDPITLAMGKIASQNVFADANTWTTYSNSTWVMVLHYLYFAVIVELLWAIIYLFRWFIQFGYGLFEKERKL